jgi:succinate dehydrogenase / fumarate reductase iron-sulfur subunit
MLVSVYRYNPDVDEVPAMRDVEVDIPEGKDLMVLDVLQLIKIRTHPLAFVAAAARGYADLMG